MKSESEFIDRLNRLIGRVEGWSYGDSDAGSGLPEEDLSRATARFWRGQDDAAGTGLGLAIAGEIAAGHGGAIAVERAPEGGLLVRYHLPGASAST